VFHVEFYYLKNVVVTQSVCLFHAENENSISFIKMIYGRCRSLNQQPTFTKPCLFQTIL